MVRTVVFQAEHVVSAIVIILVCSVGAVEADFTFGIPTEVPNVNTSSEEFNASISADGLSLYFISSRAGGVGGRDIWVTTRETTDDGWAEPTNLGPTVNTPAGEWGVSISSDSLSLYFDTKQAGASGAVNDLWVATRATTDDDWGNPVSLGPTVNSGADDYVPSISADGLALYFTSGPGRGGYGNYDLWVTMRETRDDPWGEPVNLGPTVNSSAYDLDPGISSDGRTLFFTRGYGIGQTEIWVTMRATTDDPWGEPMKLGSTINSLTSQGYPNVSADGSTLFFRASLSGRRDGGDIWQAPITPIVDLNGDGAVDSGDMAVMVYHWGQNVPLCDIGPTPLGDGIVDVEDLIVLAEHLSPGFECVAHWPLDEAGGALAHDSIGDKLAMVLGYAAWRPDEGMIGGALALDGVDDYISTDFAVNPKADAVRVVCWIKSDLPGRAIVSQTAAPLFGSTWLGTDTSDGTLQSNMMPLFPELISTRVVTDGQWHEVAVEWDGTYRRLWVDMQQVAQDTEPMTLPPIQWEGPLTFGAAEDLAPDSYFSGLIDDIRIYTRTIAP